MPRPDTIPARRAKWQTDLARERRQEREATAAGNRRKAAEHADRIRRLEIERMVHAERYRSEPAGAVIQQEMML